MIASGDGIAFAATADPERACAFYAPSGGRIAWFHDPDGNTLSLTQRS